ncbi:MAG: nickel-responsive transcriptional regulator NikR [Rhodocyclaceae bacterium]|nr:nickel-responsive transcriptional regulator NikR [Rhodocyclaceae bacterium]
MERITISLDEDLAREFDQLIAARGYQNRSEAMRDLLRAHLEEARQSRDEATHCVANLSYVFNHHERDLAERLTEVQHQHHDLTVASLHAHLDHDNCLESVILRGPTAAVRAFAEALSAERGVRHGLLNLVTVDVDPGNARHLKQHGHAHPHPHPHGNGPSYAPAHHSHFKPRS